MYRSILKSIPGSYDDFVVITNGWMEKDQSIRDAIIGQLEKKPDSNTDEITTILWDCLGIGEPIEIVDDDSPFRHVKTAML